MASMAAMPAPSPPGMHLHRGGPPGPPQINGHVQPGPLPQKSAAQMLAQSNEATWMLIGTISEGQGDLDGAKTAYEQCLRHNNWNIAALNAISCILRTKEDFRNAAEYLNKILQVEANNGDEPKLWYGIGILYDRYGSLDHAEEAFSQVMRMQPDFEKANEIYFRLGIIYKQQTKYDRSLECFKYIVTNPPRPLTEEDIWFQIGHVHEQKKDYENAKTAYQRVLERDPKHAKVLQQLGWLFHQQSNSFQSQDRAIEYLEQSVSSDQTDAQSWYLLGRCYMSQQKYPKAFEAYQQAVYRDGRNPTFWCSIGVLYYQINQYRDALDAYSRAIRLNPYISEVWYDLGTLYESCNNQINDAMDAYRRAADLDPSNMHIKTRISLLRQNQANGTATAPPQPSDIHPSAYASGAPSGPPAPQWGNSSHPPSSHGPPPPPPGPQGLPTQAPPSQDGEYTRRLASIQSQPPPPAPYGEREAMGPPPPRQPSPMRQEPPRPPYEPSRPPSARREMSPAPHNGPPNMPPQHYPKPPQHHQPPPSRIANPNYGAPVGGPSGLAPVPHSVLPPAAHIRNDVGGPVPPYGRGNTPPPEIRPIIENRGPSPNSNYHHSQPYASHAPNPSQPGGIAAGAPLPPAAQAMADAAVAARERDERQQPLPPKRLREWEDESSPSKKAANEDNRVRPDESPYHLRQSPPDRNLSPREQHRRRSSSEARRAEDQRRANENYHPSEAAHHPPTLPAMMPPNPHPHGPPQSQPQSHPPLLTPQQSQPLPQQAPQPLPPQPQPQPQPQALAHAPQLPPMAEAPKEDRARELEPPARKMDMDENYDEDDDEDKKAVVATAGPPPSSSSHMLADGPPPSNGIAVGPAKVEPVS
ncbi:MAG: glucose repression mediator protein [Vezdaea aestivalis]|nr:MAG: glucose repression mediator protein [Vezdaea aestivalis]